MMKLNVSLEEFAKLMNTPEEKQLFKEEMERQGFTDE